MAVGFRILPLGAGPIGASPAWLNPRGALRALMLSTHLTPLALNLRGRDKFFGAAGEPPRYDRPNPIIAPRALALGTHLTPLALNLRGRDKFFGAAGEPPRYDWPNPGIPLRPNLGRAASTPPTLYGADRFFTAGGPRYDWPNPLIAKRALGLSTHIQTLGPLSGGSGAPVSTYGWPNPP
jgi:hypothetical protein